MNAVLATLLLLSSAPPGTSDALVKLASESTHAADEAVRSEVIAGGYRIGLVVGPPRTVWVRTADGQVSEEAPAEDATHFVGVILRDEHTKAFLPQAPTRAAIGSDGEVTLTEMWDARFPLYGANVSVPDGAERAITIQTGPVRYGRLGESLGRHKDEVSADFNVTFGAPGEATVADAFSPTEVEEGYTPGTDIVDALDKATETVVGDDYVVAFIVRDPQPEWLWTDSVPTLRAIEEGQTHHLEIALFDRVSGLPVTGAAVSLALHQQDADTDAEETTRVLNPLLGTFPLYGANLQTDPGEYEVVARIAPPVLATLEAGRFRLAEASFHFSEGPTAAPLAARAEGDITQAVALEETPGNKAWLLVLCLVFGGGLILASWFNRRSSLG